MRKTKYVFGFTSATLAAFVIVISLGANAEKASEKLSRATILTWTSQQRAQRYPKLQEIFPSHKIRRGTKVLLQPAGKPLSQKYFSVDNYMKKYGVVGVIAIEDGEIRLEKYAQGYDKNTLWASYSVAKSVTSMLVGVALQQGDISSLDDPLQKYIPELKEGEYGKVTVRQLLTMTSGIRWNEDYDDMNSDVEQMYSGACNGNEAYVIPYMKNLPRQYPAGTHWHYNTGETDLLGVLVQRATKSTLAGYLEKHIWRLYGMKNDGYWLEDECDGSDTGGSGLQATLGDYARIGQFMLGGGKINGKQIVAPEWMKNATKNLFPAPGARGGYGYLWWINDDGSYMASGIFGQMIYVNPRRKLVIAQIANWPKPTSSELQQSQQQLIKGISVLLDNE